jgi:hypothetical protein
MADYQTDLWNITTTTPYTVTLNDTMTVVSDGQYLDIESFNSSTGSSEPIWEVIFLSNSTFEYFTFLPGSGGVINNHGVLGCTNGNVAVEVSETGITFVGTGSYTSMEAIENIGQIQTFNGGGDFNGGQLVITLTTS